MELNDIIENYNLEFTSRKKGDDISPRLRGLQFILKYQVEINAADYVSIIRNCIGRMQILKIDLFQNKEWSLVFIKLGKEKVITKKDARLLDYLSVLCEICNTRIKKYNGLLQELKQEEAGVKHLQIMRDGVFCNEENFGMTNSEKKIYKVLKEKYSKKYNKILKIKDEEDSIKFSHLHKSIQNTSSELKILNEKITNNENVINLFGKYLTNISNVLFDYVNNNISIKNISNKIKETQHNICSLFNKSEVSEHVGTPSVYEFDDKVIITSLKSYDELTYEQLEKSLVIDGEGIVEYTFLSEAEKDETFQKIFEKNWENSNANYIKYKTEKSQYNQIYSLSPLEKHLKYIDFRKWEEYKMRLVFNDFVIKRMKNRPEFYQKGDKLDKESYLLSNKIKRLQIWYRICPDHNLFKEKDPLKYLESYEGALGITKIKGKYRVKCSKNQKKAFFRYKTIIAD